MEFYHNMHGDGMGTVLVYLLSRDGSLQALWIKSRNQGNQWRNAQVNVNCTEECQVRHLFSLHVPFVLIRPKVPLTYVVP